MIARFEAQALAALVNLVGHTWNGKDIVINVTSEVQNDVGVTVYKYEPHLFQNLSMTMAVVLSDPAFITSWKTDANIQDLNHGDTVGIFKEQCSHSELLKARFQICGNKWGWQAQIARISLDPWQPANRRIFFRILRKAAGAAESRQSKLHKIKIQFSNDESPAFWAVPEDNCEFPALHPDSLESPSQDLSVPFKQAMVSLGSSPRAMCNYIKRNCEHILVPNPVQSSDGKSFITKSFGEIVRGAFKATWQSRASGRTISQIASSMVAPLLRCARQAEQKLPWAWTGSWQADLAIDEAEEHFGKVSPDVIWIKGFGDEQLSGQVDERPPPPPLPVEVKDLFKIVNDTDSDEDLIRDACGFLYRPIMMHGWMRTMEEIKEVDGLVGAAAIQEILLAAVLDTNNPAAVQLFGRWCFSDFLLMSEHQRENAVQLVWESAKSSRNDLQILNKVLHWNEGPRIGNNAGFVNALLQFATSQQCLECCNLLFLVVREQGDKWSPLFFGDFRLGLGQNSLNFLQPNITVPWLCIENNLNIYYTEFPGFETSKPIAPALIHGLQDFWKQSKQLKMCDGLTAGPKGLILDEDVLLKGSELDFVIRLSPKVFVTLDPDGTNYLVEEIDQITAMKNLELGLFWKAVDTTVSNVEQILKVVGAKLRFDGRNRTLRTNIKPKALASTKTERGLPGLVLRVEEKHTSMALRNWVVTDVEAKALGAALALSPVEEINIRNNKEITDKGIVALFTPLLESNSSSLRKIDMGYTQMTDEGIGVVEDLMKKFPLEKIRMPQTRITDKGVASLLYGLESCPSLVSMQVSGSNLDVQGIIQTLQNTSWRSLRRVHMHHDSSRSGLDVEHTSIRLWGPIVTDVEAKALGAALALSPVEEIDIRDNKEITDEGAVALITPLLESNSSSLRKIDMAFTSITDAGLHVFGETLQSLQNGSCSLKSISVWQKKSHSTFGDEGVASLLRGLERCPNLVYVDAEGPNLRSQTMQNACQALNARWPNLETFYVTYENQLYDLTNYHCQ